MEDKIALGLPESCFLLSQLFLRLLELLLRLIELLPSLIQPLPSLIRQAHVMISALEHVFIDFAPLHERRAADVFTMQCMQEERWVSSWAYGNVCMQPLER